MPATCRDHVVPVTVWRAYESIGIKPPENRILMVPSCRECNSFLGSTIQRTLEERKRFLKQKLRKRYKKLLASPLWKDDEIDALGPHLKGMIRDLQNQQKIVRLRLSW
jgi:hypothetical protein